MDDDEETGGEPAGEKKDTKPAGDGDLATRLRKLERQNKEQARDLQRYRDSEKTKADAEKSDLEKANARIAELEASISDRDAALSVAKRRAAFELAAHKAGVVDVEAATLLANLDDLEIGDDGTVGGVDDLMAGLKEKRGFLFGSTKEEPSAFGGGGNTGAASGVRLYSQKEIEAMDSAAFEKFDADVAAGLARPK